MKNSIEITKSSDGKVQSGKIYMGKARKLAFNHKYDDVGLLREIEFDGQGRDLPTVVELYNLLNNQFIQVAKVMELPKSEGATSTSVLDVRAMETVESRPITSNRTGRAIWLDSFENYTALISEKWGFSAGGAVTFGTDYPCLNRYYCKIVTPATAGANISLFRYAFPPAFGRLGLEFDFRLHDAIGDFHDFTAEMVIDNGLTAILGSMYYDCAAQTWMYADATGNNQFFGDQVLVTDTLAGGYPFWHHAKLTVDFLADTYGKFVCDDREWDLSMHRLYHAGTNWPNLMLRFNVTNGAANVARIIGLDNIILTDSEP